MKIREAEDDKGVQCGTVLAYEGGGEATVELR